ncbi:uncharacterized protein BO97DRAFT_435078 [Aspergillus homomorphus CBS 101889]|uniref:GABA permease n=1 Tax=Aspergillus homomorphus (strain CBS 101889) TaxID=1450537 RepID=A0A395HV54_ASPHC|nr:hypothetical protein BO97DRAFT_435078 [Aspergillus homomorphus CBS 101889]RAL11687.1 hypothetical protein BO97DRAFT_435078 [Aspergillus homomorphus CBS 101889]
MVEAPKQTPNSGTEEELTLEHLGYQQEFERTFSLLVMVGFSFSIVTCCSALSGVFIIGVTAGGPAVMLFGWVGVCVSTFAVALAMAEWFFMLAPSWIARLMSYITGWLMITGILAMGSANSQLYPRPGKLVYPGLVIQRWHTVLVTYAVAIWAFAVNIWMPHLLNRPSRAILLWNVASFLIIIIVLLATRNDKQDAAFVFQDLQNMTGFSSAMATMVGILQSFFGMCCYDTPSHMNEEIMHPSRNAPLAMIMSIGMGAVTEFIFLLTLCLCIGKIGTCFMASMMTTIMMVASVSLVAEGSRALFAFARDRGLPFSGLLATVAQRRMIPINPNLVAVVIQMAFNSIYFGTFTGFNTIVSIATTGFYVSYALVLLSGLLGHAFGHHIASGTTGPFPSEDPVTSESMNYTSAAVGIIAFLSIATWFTTARKQFKGPADIKGLASLFKKEKPEDAFANLTEEE